MKINQNQLQQHLSQKLSHAYLVSGDDPLLVQEASDAIRLAARQQRYEERIVFHADNSFNWIDLLDEANALSLFSSQRILEVRLSGKPSDKGAVLKKIIGSTNPDNLLLVISPRLDASTQKTTWVKAFENDAVWLPVWPIDRSHYEGWLRQRCQQNGLAIDQAALALLAQQTEGNLLAAVQEIEKLKLLNLQNIGLDVMQEAISNNARFNAFELSDIILSGNLAAANRMLNSLQSEGMEPILILGALVRKIRQLISLKKHNNSEIRDALKKQGVWPRQQQPYIDAYNRIPTQQLYRSLAKAEEVDNAVKGSGDDPWRLLHELLLMLSNSYKLIPN